MHILCDAAHRTPVHSDAPESIKPTCAGHGAVGWRSACDAAESARAGNTLEATPERVDPRGSRPSCASDPGRAGGPRAGVRASDAWRASSRARSVQAGNSGFARLHYGVKGSAPEGLSTWTAADLRRGPPFPHLRLAHSAAPFRAHARKRAPATRAATPGPRGEDTQPFFDIDRMLQLY